MRLQVFHRTRYLYRVPVSDSYNEVRLRPVTNDTSRLEFFLLNVQPPVKLRHFRDSYLNYVHFFEISEPHLELSIEAQCTINTTSPYREGLPKGVEMGALAHLEDEMLREFLDSSRYVGISPELWKLGLDITAGCTDVFTAAQQIRTYIRQNWTYAQNTTTASTHVSEVMESRSGVCQDFTHLMIGICRAIGIPARYVSGYLFNGGDASLRGAQASHAWCEIYVPGKGWFGLDPTNDTLADERHIKIATGRDYNDAAPVSGRFVGAQGATAALQVDLRIEELPH
jgi:transglutaminase-like putative cysteine protease